MGGFMRSWMEVDNGRGSGFFLVVEGEKVSNENQKGEVNKIWMHVCLFKIAGYLVFSSWRRKSFQWKPKGRSE